MTPEHLQLLAHYNQWMNEKLYAAAEQLDPVSLAENRGAFFGSVLGTLNHLVVADRIWLSRFVTHPQSGQALAAIAALPRPQALDQILFEDFQQLKQHRTWLDQQICQWVAILTETDLDYVLAYHNSKGEASNKRLGDLLIHFFNHQTHHRGQVTTLLSQLKLDVGVTDLLALIANETADHHPPPQQVDHISCFINCPPAQVYHYAANPLNLPDWAAGLAQSAVTKEGDHWIVDAPFGKATVRFVETNTLGVMDHEVTLESGQRIYNPLRVVPRNNGSEIIFTLIQRAEQSTTEFAQDKKAVENDLQTLKRLLENPDSIASL